MQATRDAEFDRMTDEPKRVFGEYVRTAVPMLISFAFDFSRAQSEYRAGFTDYTIDVPYNMYLYLAGIREMTRD